MTAPTIILTIMALACILWGLLLIDRAQFKAFRRKRDEQANRAWWRKRGGE